MKINKQVTTVLLASSLLIGGLGSGFLLTPSPTILQAAPAQQVDPAQSEITQTDTTTDTQDAGSEADKVGDTDTVEKVGATDEGDDVDGANETEGSDTEDNDTEDNDTEDNDTEDNDTEDNDTEDNDSDEADEGVPPTTGITAEEAQAIVEQANPGAKTVDVEFEKENGVDMFEVELDNGKEVEVDANDGTILATEGDDADED